MANELSALTEIASDAIDRYGITHEPTHPMGRLLGDLLVRTESAGGRCRERTVPVDPEAVVHLGGLTHFNLLHHPQVYEVLRLAISAPAGT